MAGVGWINVESRQPPLVPVWIAAAALSLLLGVALAQEPLAIVLVLAPAVLATLLVGTFVEPRWALLAELFLLYSYAGWVLGHKAGTGDLSPAILILVVAAVLARRRFAGEHVRFPHEAAPLLVLAFVWTLSAAFAADPGRSLSHIVNFLAWAAVAIATMALIEDMRWFRRVLWTLVVAAGLLGALAVVQQITGMSSPAFGGLANTEVAGSGSFPRSAGPLQANYFAEILVTAAALACYLAIAARTERARVGALTALAACVAGTVFSGSRGGLVAAVAVIALLFMLRPVRRQTLVAVLAPPLLIALLLLPSSYTQRVEVLSSALGDKAETSQDRALRGRASENLAALRMFEDHPLAGVGPANYPVNYLRYSERIGIDPRVEERAPHSLYLESLAETGLFGTPVFLFVLWLALRGPWRARKLLRNRDDALIAEGTFVAVAGFLVAGLFLHSAYPRYLWIVVGLGLTAGRLANRSEAPEGETAET